MNSPKTFLQHIKTLFPGLYSLGQLLVSLWVITIFFIWPWIVADTLLDKRRSKYLSDKDFKRDVILLGLAIFICSLVFWGEYRKCFLMLIKLFYGFIDLFFSFYYNKIKADLNL